MKLVSPQHYKDIEFVPINSLPENQQTQLKEWLPEVDKIEVDTGNTVLPECVTYSQYVFWFDHVYNSYSTLEDQI